MPGTRRRSQSPSPNPCARPKPRSRTGAARGKPAEALIAEAERTNALMIVVGNRRMQGIGRLLGSVANSVAHNAPCDVYIAKTDSAV